MKKHDIVKTPESWGWIDVVYFLGTPDEHFMVVDVKTAKTFTMTRGDLIPFKETEKQKEERQNTQRSYYISREGRSTCRGGEGGGGWF